MRVELICFFDQKETSGLQNADFDSSGNVTMDSIDKSCPSASLLEKLACQQVQMYNVWPMNGASLRTGKRTVLFNGALAFGEE